MKIPIARFAIPAAVLLAGVAQGGGFDASRHHGQTDYFVTNLSSLGGTNSRGNSINNLGWIAGYSNLEGDQIRHASLWLYGFQFDLGTLGDPDTTNSSVAWSQAMNNRGLIAGISQTDTPDPRGEEWSCRVFFPPATATGPTCRAVVWEWGAIRALPTLDNGNNSFATAVNNRGEVTGWSENGVEDPTNCVPPQVFQFRPVIWGPGSNQIRDMPLIPGDSSGTVNAINDRGQAVGISGICDQAVGRFSAKHAVLWENGTVRDIGNIGGAWWNTPTAINQRGDIVGFLGDPDDPDGFLQAFLWTSSGGIQPLGTLPDLTPEHVHSEAYGINERRQVVGLSCDADFIDCRAVLWQDGVATDLNTLVAPGYDDTLLHARDINDLGMITGFAFDADSGERSTYWAIPIPRHGRDGRDTASPAAQAGGHPIPRVALPDDVKREIFHPLSSGHAKLAR